jgi:hypothetical protein
MTEEINIENLISQGYVEDDSTAASFQKRFRPALVLIVPFVLGMILTYAKMIPILEGITVVCLSLILIGIVVVRSYVRPVISLRSGEQMIKYLNANPLPHIFEELVYVCPKSKTFFRRTKSERGSI